MENTIINIRLDVDGYTQYLKNRDTSDMVKYLVDSILLYKLRGTLLGIENVTLRYNDIEDKEVCRVTCTGNKLIITHYLQNTDIDWNILIKRYLEIHEFNKDIKEDIDAISVSYNLAVNTLLTLHLYLSRYDDRLLVYDTLLFNISDLYVPVQYKAVWVLSNTDSRKFESRYGKRLGTIHSEGEVWLDNYIQDTRYYSFVGNVESYSIDLPYTSNLKMSYVEDLKLNVYMSEGVVGLKEYIKCFKRVRKLTLVFMDVVTDTKRLNEWNEAIQELFKVSDRVDVTFYDMRNDMTMCEMFLDFDRYKDYFYGTVLNVLGNLGL